MAMSNRTDSLFSLDRLRKAWAGPKVPAGGTPAAVEASTASPPRSDVPLASETLAEVVRLVRLRFPGAKGRAFEPLLGDLEEKVMLRFDNAPGRSVPEEERDALNCSIDELLRRIENLAEAMDTAKRLKKSAAPQARMDGDPA